MTTTNLKNGIENAGDEILANLGPEKRAKLMVKHAAAGNTEHVKRLTQTAPTYTYEATDLAFNERLTTLTTMALSALYELETAAWRFFYKRADGILAEANYDRFPDAEWTTEPAPENDFHERGAREAAVRFAAQYRAWTRFAEEEVGVSLAEFLNHPHGGTNRQSVERIEYAVGLAEGDFDPADGADVEEPVGWATGTVVHDGEDLTADELAERNFEQLKCGTTPARWGHADLQ